eukprot:2545513-Amphidinium_carterae.1
MLFEVLDRGELRVGGFEADWGRDGNYQLDHSPVRVDNSRPSLHGRDAHYRASTKFSLRVTEATQNEQEGELTDCVSLLRSSFIRTSTLAQSNFVSGVKGTLRASTPHRGTFDVPNPGCHQESPMYVTSSVEVSTSVEANPV